MAEQPTTLWTRDDDQFEALAEAYFAHIAQEDLADIDASARLQRVETHVRLADTRRSARPAVAVTRAGHRSVVQVATDDMPYLVDSVTSEVTRCGHAISLVVHPILLTKRSTRDARLKAVQSLPTQGRSLSSGDTQALPSLAAFIDEQDRFEVESWITVELDRVIDEEAAETLTAGLSRVLHDVRASHSDQERMIAQAHRAASTIRRLDGVMDRDESAEFVEWMGQGNFLFLGYREYSLTFEGGEPADAEGSDPSDQWPDDEDIHARLEPVPGTGLGILADVDGVPRSRSSSELSAAGRARALQPRALVITKANSRSTVRRRTYMDYVAVKTFGDDGQVMGERRFLGLFSQRAYTQSISTIPLLRSRAKQLLARSGFSPDSHSGSDLLQILETYPRNELMQMDIAEVEEVAWQILQLQERRRIKLFLRKDHYGRFMTALLYLPRDRYNTNTRQRTEAELMAHIDAESIDFTVRLSDSVLARVFFRMRLNPDAEEMSISEEDLEVRLARAVRSWGEGIAEEAAARYSLAHADRISSRWGEAFPPEYRAVYEVPDALHDAAEFETLQAQPEAGPRLYFYAPDQDDPADMRLKLYLADAKTLTDTLPIIDDFGLSLLDERAYTIVTADGETCYLYDLGICYPAGVDAYGTSEVFKEAYHQVLVGRVESDEFSRLVLHLQMDIRRVTVLRAYAKYMRQLGMPNSYDFLADALLSNPEVARALVALFTAKFDPNLGSGRAEAVQACHDQVLTALESVKTLDADRVLSAFLNLIDATDRTNLYQGKDWVALKLRPQSIDAAPAPRPAHEIWVYSPTVEGSHLRFDRIARGGLRWSDRSEDFRTEVLGLVKAQMVKNAVIVPSGAKGGFYPKQLPDPTEDRSAWLKAGREAYMTFIRAMLDLTDNQVTGEDTMRVVAPDNVIRHDGDDPYLVVAADKGTAAFSDTANEISQEYGHWLGDAFASGGSVGYDHKAMGITARGAWESVKSHFKTLGHDTQTQDFTVVGIGDMGGDVMGNGMLLSEHIKLVAAFNHLHIFIDPDPDPQLSHAERKRLFTAKKSGWDAYDPDLISTGGGVFSRDARSIDISPQMQERFGIEADQLTPPALITALLKAPIDLLYNGGIGTYIKAETESHEDVGDRANNGIRINGADVGAQVVAEGGNLGLTQAGRIEAAQCGVLLNTDAIDNSAGVDCSDHEVNIKIFLEALVSSGLLESESRNGLLEEMTEEVAELVLRTNEDQNVLLLAERHRLTEWSPSFGRLIAWLEANAGLDRQLEVLPTDQEMQQRLDARVAPLTAPEIAVLAAYAKIHLKGALAESSLPADPWLRQTLENYFPGQLTARFSEQLPRHPLAERIIANEVANDVINMAGSTFVFRTIEETFASPAQVVRAFLVARELFNLAEFDAALRRLPVDFPTSSWAEAYVDMRRLLDRAVRWLVNHGVESDSLENDIAAYQVHMAPLYRQLNELLAGPDAERVSARRQEVLQLGMGEELAAWYAELFESFSLLDIAALARAHSMDSRIVAEVYYAVYADFDADSLLNHITNLPREDKWQALARGAQRDELYFALHEITQSILTTTDAQQDAQRRLDEWKQANASSLARAERLSAEVRDHQFTMASITVLLRHLRGLVGA
ncbi:NAD-glutamate dehydrogenase [Nesterenkonia natronophila]|uniref:NAD-glutamate dehydrogenase n=1 Tax=Nesterenkonia natronophila TaxID=2174932 RepID=A0A3A4F1W8_9MICC|nr:NAD-glutamate dehydrogenase [Nesterenkonia natronophila]RJN31826.1 NAD-glutamate dehydrogenase [Nesterenkonia natronophila]